MSSILSLKKAITLDEAAEHLSKITSEAVTASDLLDLALDGQLTLSVTMPGNYWAYPYNTSAPKEAGGVYKKLEHNKSAPRFSTILIAQVNYRSYCINGEPDSNEKSGPDFLDGRTISGTWDLPMLGMERELATDLSGAIRENTITFTGCEALENNKPIILQHPKDADLLVGLFDEDEDCIYENENFCEIDTIDDPEVETGLFLIGFSVRKVQQFPAGSFLVIRTENLQDFVSKIDISEQVTPEPATAIPDSTPEDVRLLQDAWRLFWTNATPRDRSTRPDNAAVVAWLTRNGMSGRLAKAGATMISPDWARKGGRR